MTSSPLVDKLRAADNALSEIIDSKDRKNLDRSLWGVLEAIRRAIQIAQEDAPEVPRQPYEAVKGGGLGGKEHSLVQRHESFGVISISKPSGGGMRLFGAMADSLPSCISIRVQRARRDIDSHLHTEYCYPEAPVLEIRMSTYQWSELICNMMGGFIPCTIDSVLGVRMDPVPQDVKNPLDIIVDDTRAEAIKHNTDPENEFLAAVDAVLQQVDALGLSKAKASGIKGRISKLKDFVHTPKATAAWAVTRIAEETHRAISHGRVEMAAALHSLIHGAGLKSIQNRLESAVGLQLSEGESNGKGGKKK